MAVADICSVSGMAGKPVRRQSPDAIELQV